MTLQRIESACERVVTAYGPLGLAVIMFLSILALQGGVFENNSPFGDADARNLPDLTGEVTYATDNLFRWGLSHGLRIEAEMDVNDRCVPYGSAGITNCGNNSAGAGGEVTYAFWCGADPFGIGNLCGFPSTGLTTAQKRTAVENIRHGNLICLLYGSPSGNDNCGQFASHNLTEEASFGENRSLMNITWGGSPKTASPGLLNVSATNIHLGLITSNSGGSGTTMTVYVNFYNYTGAIFYRANMGTISCTAAALTNLDHVIPSYLEGIRMVEINVDFTNCALGPPNNVAIFSMGGFRLWAVGSLTDSVTFSEDKLEYGDWLLLRTGVPVGAVNSHNVASRTNATVKVPPGISWFYFGGSCVNGAAHCYSSGMQSLTYPQGWSRYDGFPAPTSGCIRYQWYGPSVADIGGSARAHLNTFRITNLCTSTQNIRLSGTANNVFTYFSGPFDPITINVPRHGDYYANAFATGGAADSKGNIHDNLGDSTRPIAGWYYYDHGAIGTGFYTYSLGYPDNTGPLVTVPCCHPIFRVDNMFDVSNLNITANTACPVTTSSPTNCSLTYTVDNNVWGNAFYWHYVVINATLPPGCEANVKIDGLPVDVTWESSGLFSNNTYYLSACFYLIDDLRRAQGFDVNETGQNLGLGSSQRLVVNHQISVTDWSNLRPPNGPSGLGYQLYSIDRVDGKHAERIVCGSVVDVTALERQVCYGNHDTSSLDLPGSLAVSSNINILVCDGGLDNIVISQLTSFDSCRAQNLPMANATVLEDSGGLVAYTNVTGRSVFLTAGSGLNLTWSKLSYRPAFFNASDLDFPTYNFTVYLSRNQSLSQDLFCAYFSNLSAQKCIIAYNAAPTQPCTTFNEQGQCSTTDPEIPYVDNILVCPLNGVTRETIPVVSWADTASDEAGTINIDLASVLQLPDGNFEKPCLSTTTYGPVGFVGATWRTFSDNLNLTLAAEGHRQITANVPLSSLGAEVTIITAQMKTGSGVASSVRITYDNVTILDPLGFVRNALLVIIVDTAAPSAVTGFGPAPSTGLAEAIKAGCLRFIGTGAANMNLCGFGLFSMLTLLPVAVWYGLFRSRPSETLVGGMMVPAFSAVAYIGLWEVWLLVVIILAIAALTYYGLKNGQQLG